MKAGIIIFWSLSNLLFLFVIFASCGRFGPSKCIMFCTEIYSSSAIAGKSAAHYTVVSVVLFWSYLLPICVRLFKLLSLRFSDWLRIYLYVDSFQQIFIINRWLKSAFLYKSIFYIFAQQCKKIGWFWCSSAIEKYAAV